jgi:hypothetical protein
VLSYSSTYTFFAGPVESAEPGTEIGLPVRFCVQFPFIKIKTSKKKLPVITINLIDSYYYCYYETINTFLSSVKTMCSSKPSSPLSSTPSVFEQAASLNNEGVSALCSNEEETAITIFTNSIRLMKRELSKPGVDLTSFQKEGCCMELPAHLVELPQHQVTPQQLMIFEDEDEEALFNHAISIPLSAFSDTKQPSDLDIHIYSASVVFNLALAHQQLASKHKQDRRMGKSDEIYTTNRNKAEKLYTVILKLLQDSACSQVRTGVMVKLAAIHNLHWIQYQKREQEGTQSSNIPSLQQTLARFVQGIRQQDPHLARSFLEHDAQIQGLLMNVLWLKEQQAPPKVAPAA